MTRPDHNNDPAYLKGERATPWSCDQEAAFFDAIANGSAIAAASRSVGKPLGSGASKFRRFALSLGRQGL